MAVRMSDRVDSVLAEYFPDGEVPLGLHSALVDLLYDVYDEGRQEGFSEGQESVYNNMCYDG